MFTEGIVHAPKQFTENEQTKKLNKVYGSKFSPKRDGEWHGRRCKILGRWRANGYYYAAVSFPESGDDYEIINARLVRDFDG